MGATSENWFLVSLGLPFGVKGRMAEASVKARGRTGLLGDLLAALGQEACQVLSGSRPYTACSETCQAWPGLAALVEALKLLRVVAASRDRQRFIHSRLAVRK